MQPRCRRSPRESSNGSAALQVLVTAYVRFPNALAWHALEAARGLQPPGMTCCCFCKRSAPLATWSEGAPFAVNRELDPAMNALDFSRAFLSVRRAVRDFRPDVLNPHCPPGHTYLALRARWIIAARR